MKSKNEIMVTDKTTQIRLPAQHYCCTRLV